MSAPLPDVFSSDCEAPGPLRVAVMREGGGSRVEALPGPFGVVGTDPRCDLRLDDPRVGPRRCYLQAFGPKVLCVDLGREPLLDTGSGPVPAAWIDTRHGVRLAGHVLALAPDGPEGWAAGPVDESVGDDPLVLRREAGVDLEFRAGMIQTCWRVKRPVTFVGTSPRCAVKLNGPGVSPIHAALVLTAAGLWVVDLLGAIDAPGAGGICLNGEPVRFARLGPLDTLTIDRFSIRAGSPRPRSPAPPPALVRPSPPTPVHSDDALRREFEARAAEQDARHRAEIEVLRREVEDLRDLVEDLRHEVRARPARPHRGVAPGGRRRPRPTGVRTLGAARAAVSAPQPSPADLGHPPLALPGRAGEEETGGVVAVGFPAAETTLMGPGAA